MAKATTTKNSKPQAVVDSIDVSSALSEDQMPVSPGRRSKWTELLDSLYTMTENGDIPRADDGSLQFVKLGAFGNANGARTQVRAIENRDDGAYAGVYDFKAITTQAGSELWGRVAEVADDADAAN